MYSDVFCKVYNELGWNYYPEVFGEQLLTWLRQNAFFPKTSMDLACGTGILCEILQRNGIQASGMDFSEGMIEIARRNSPEISYEVADMITFCPDRQYDLVTCTGDALNHIMELSDVEQIFRNIHQYLRPGGWLIFDILNENEVSDSEPFEMEFSETVHVWFQMTKPEEATVNLCVRVFENGEFRFEENIREKIHDPERICSMLQRCGFEVVRCSDSLLDAPDCHGTTWFVLAQSV